MDDSEPWVTSVPHLGLIDTAELVGGHRLVEQRLFVLTGRWSVDAAAGSDPAGIAGFLATQSANHAWRLAEWEQRSPRSVDVPEPAEVTGWSQALDMADSTASVTARLACWSHVLAVHLAVRYSRHMALTSPVADAGLERWLGIAQRDVLDGVVQGAAISAESQAYANSGQSAAEVADAVAACVVPLLEPGV